MTDLSQPLIPNTYQADDESMRANRARFNYQKHNDECFLCGRGLTAKAVENGKMIHLATSNELIHRDDDAVASNNDNDGIVSQGCFPVGSECAKRIPNGYLR